VRLNLGCGDWYSPDWTNVDFGTTYRVDERVDLTRDLPAHWHDVTHVYAGHVLEHLHVGDALDLLEELRLRMAPFGQIMVVGPDIDIALQMKDAGTLDIPMESLLYGAARWPGDEHQWACTAGDLVAMLDHTGWGEATPMKIDDVPAEWPVAVRGPQWQCAVSAVAS
jgi:hypothetical protein